MTTMTLTPSVAPTPLAAGAALRQERRRRVVHLPKLQDRRLRCDLPARGGVVLLSRSLLR